jgi:hypothetical protein
MKFLKKTPLTVLLLAAGFVHAADTYESKLSQLRADPDNYTWLQERSIEGVEFANEVLCIIKNTGADLAAQVNQGPYLAAVDKTLCSKSSPSASAATGAEGAGNSAAKIYEFFVIDSKTDASNLYVKVWIPVTPDKIKADHDENEIHAQFVFPLNRAGSDIGFSELHFKALPVDNTGAIKPGVQGAYGVMKPVSTANGYTLLQSERWFDNNGVDQGGQWMSLSRTGTGDAVTLTGFTKNMVWDNAQSKDVPVVFQVAANKNEFFRKQSTNDGTTWDAGQCFNRNDVKFNTWNYTLFDKETRAVVGVNSNYQFRYKEFRGNYSGNGTWMSDTAYSAVIAAGGQVDVEVEMDNNDKATGVLKMQNGGFRKVKNIATTLSALTDSVFEVWTGDTKAVRLVWKADANGVKKFMTEETPAQASVPYTWPQAVQYWDNLWLNTNGGGYRLSIPQKEETVQNGNSSYQRKIADFSALSDQTRITSRQETAATPAEVASLANTTLNCLNNCPYFDANGTLIGVSANDVNGSVNSGTYPNNGSWFRGGKGYQYTFNAAQGTLTATSGNTSPLQYSAFETKWVQGRKAITSGPLIPVSEKTLDALVAENLCTWDQSKSSICGWQRESEIPEYFVWRTGEMAWDKTWTLSINGQVPKMEDPILVKYTCPDSSYGCTPNTSLVLNYNGPKQLWGIPNRCVDSKDYSVEVDCNDNSVPNKQWLNKFNLTKSPINADEAKDWVVSATDPSKKYLILPQGSNEFYGTKNACTEVVLTNGTYSPVDTDAHYNPEMTNLGAIPLDYKTVPVTVRDGVKLR